ncbi:hypothetical protein CBW65_12885 [Tumebacillus avium]|uniref:CBM-cenC domain-containing protein n=1 Tax=Tumebacillus avium TaxID=1903704 RepID=A0A1Y0IPS6_9BACL|nr:hypothetical protein CBW65_12885 [Tumebacillus avium]
MNKSNKRFRTLSVLTLAAVLAMGNALILPQLPTKVEAAEVTLLKNGSFEQYTGTNGVANEWTLVAPDAQSTALSVVTSPVEEGTKAQKFSASGLANGHYADLNQTITNVATNTHYLVEGRFYVESLNNAQVELYIDYFDATGTIVGSAKTVQKDGHRRLCETGKHTDHSAGHRFDAGLRAATRHRGQRLRHVLCRSYACCASGAGA